ncbi:hypothetical protein L7F22_024300 [Adiantum nelumboides]|nr:hypothetical protein [Adiantum nelumboides]
MGKMRLKLSHVMPHAWFYKLKEVGKPAANQFKASDSARKAVYSSPINHKAIDIPFPEATFKRSPHSRSPPDDFTSLDQLHLLELSDECRPSIVLPYAPAPEDIMSLSMEEDSLHRISSAPDVNEGPPPCEVNFDVRELERRLNALDLEDRRKYQSSPMLLSVSVPSPMPDGIPHTSIKGLVGRKGLDGYSLDACDAQEPFTLNVCVADEIIRSTCGEGIRPPLLNVSYAFERPSQGGMRNGGEELCGSIDESNHHSTSSSDTGFERGSSSMWERDVFSITSEGSEAFTAICPDEGEPGLKSRQRLWKLRERMTPSPHRNVHVDNGLSRFYEDNREMGAAEIVRMGDLCSSKHAGASLVPDVRRQAFQGGYKESCSGESLHSASYVHNDTPQTGHTGQSKRDSQYRIKMPFSPKDSYQGNKGTSFSSRKHEITMYGSLQSLPNYGEKVDSFSLPDDNNDCLSVQYDSGDDRLSVRSRLSAGRFSYATCKERILSSRTLVKHPLVDSELQEEQPLSNYAKFKLKQTGLQHSNVTGSNADMYLDPGLFNTVSRSEKHSRSHDNVTTAGIDPGSVASRQHQSSEHLLTCRQSTSSHHSKLPHVRARERRSSKHNLQEQGPSWLRGTLRAVREKTRDPSFEQFSPSTSAGGTLSSTSQSRVFDSFAMVKCSYDPRHDFKESMMEMIMEKGLHSSHDMVELLQCYLALNADAYHDTIVKVFTKVWSEMFQHV